MLYASALMVTFFCWFCAVRARTNPPRVCLIAEFTLAEDTYTATDNVTIGTFDEEKSFSAIIPSGTEIVSSDGSAFDIADLTFTNPDQASKNELGVYSNGKVYETIQFGIDGVTLIFSEPVKLRIPVDASNGTDVLVKRKGSDDIWTTRGLTVEDGTCDEEGIATPENSEYTVQNGVIEIYTCMASDFTAFKQGSSGRRVTPGVTITEEVITETPAEELPVTPTPVDNQIPTEENTNTTEGTVNTPVQEEASPVTGLFGLGELGTMIPIGIIALILIGLIVLVLKGNKTIIKKRK